MTEGISVVITTKNNSSTLPALLDSLKNQSYRNFETIVVDNHSDDGTAEIARARGALVEKYGPERSSQRNRGAQLSNFPVLLFLDSDMELSPNVLATCSRAIQTKEALCLRENVLEGKNFWAKVRRIERSCYYHSLYFEAARCLRRDVFDKIGGYDESLTGLEDMALQANLISNNISIGWVDEVIYHHEEDIGLIAYLKKRMRYGLTDRCFASKYPQFWKILNSPTLRCKVILNYLNGIDNTTRLKIVLGLLVTRGLESGLRHLNFITPK